MAITGVDTPQAHLFSAKSELHDPIQIIVNVTLYVPATAFFLISFLFDLIKTNAHLLVKCSAYRRTVLVFYHHSLHALLISKFAGYLVVHLHMRVLLLLAGEIETNPGPQTENFLKFVHWNLNSICARECVKIPLMEVYNSVHHFDIMVLSETMLDKSVKNEDIFIHGFGMELFRSDHPSNTKTSGMCVYIREGLPIKRRYDLEMLQEVVVAEKNFLCKKILFVAIYCSPSQNNEQFETVMDKLQIMCGEFQGERPYSIIVTGDFNCWSSQWWGGY